MYTASKDETVNHLKSTAQNLRSATNETAKKAELELREAANRAGRKVRDLVHTAEDEFEHAREAVTTQIRSKPIQSGLVALGIGFVLGAILRR